MKNKSRQIKVFLSSVLVFILFFSFANPFLVTAGETSSKNGWKTNNGYEYPLTPADSAWVNLSYFEQLAVCDMPMDILSNCSTEELADLVLEYPFLSDILAFDNVDLAIKHLINTSNICEEFFSRDNITDLLIERYGGMNIDYEKLFGKSNAMAIVDSGYIKEMFLQTYFAYAINSLTDTQAQEISKIIGEKYEAKKGICDDFATSLLIYDWIQVKNGAIPQYLVPENIELDSNGKLLTMGNEAGTGSNQSRATSGFTSSGSTVKLGNGGIYTVGTYTLYGETADCYKYYSNDFTKDEAAALNNNFDKLHSSWVRVYSCTRKYNCHSYTWISSSSSNLYWLNNPDVFAGSDEFECIGNSINGTLSSGNKIIIVAAIPSDDGFGNYTYAIHSANVLSSNGSTESKLGSYGVYTVPADELRSFYGGFYYNIYQ